MSDIGGKVARVVATERGKRRSFKPGRRLAVERDQEESDSTMAAAPPSPYPLPQGEAHGREGR